MTRRLTSFSYRIAQLHRAISMRLGEALAPMGVGRCQYPFLAELFLGGDGRTQDALSNALHMDKGATARVISSLEADGFVNRLTNPYDRRERLVVLTPKGDALRCTLLERLRTATEVISSDFTDEERQQALAFLDRMLVNVGAEPPGADDAAGGPGCGVFGIPSVMMQNALNRTPDEAGSEVSRAGAAPACDSHDADRDAEVAEVAEVSAAAVCAAAGNPAKGVHHA